MKKRAKKSRVRGLLIIIAALWSVIAISLGVMILRDYGYELPELLEAIGRLGFGGPAPVNAPGEMVPRARLDVVDVGQGSGMLIQLFGEDTTTILVDAGEATASDAVCGAIDGAGISRLDLIVITHPHTDHFGGAIEVLERFEVGALWLPDVSEELTPTNVTYSRFLEALGQNGCAVELKSKPERLEFSGGASLSLLDGFVEDPRDLNDTSLCLRLEVGDASFLVTGDGEAAVEERLLESGAPVAADILVAGHHGSNTSSTRQFLNAVSPSATVISAGRDNEYNLPSQKALERLSHFGNVYRTDISGTITIFTDGRHISVSADGTSDLFDAGR